MHKCMSTVYCVMEAVDPMLNVIRLMKVTIFDITLGMVALVTG